MAAGDMLVETTREWPWGLVLMTDTASSELVPQQLDHRGVAAGRTVLAVGIQHAVDGEAHAELWAAPAPEGLVCVYEGEFETSSGTVILSDAAYELDTPAHVGEGVHQLRVLVDETPSPVRVVFEIRR